MNILMNVEIILYFLIVINYLKIFQERKGRGNLSC